MMSISARPTADFRLAELLAEALRSMEPRDPEVPVELSLAEPLWLEPLEPVPLWP